MLLIQFLARIVAVLRAAASPMQIAYGFCLGMIIGLTPSMVIKGFIFLLLVVFNVNLTAGFLAIALFSLLAFVLDPLFHSLGYFLLADAGALRGLWTALYNTPFVPFTNFNNTVVLGSLIAALTAFVPVLFAVRNGIIVYRERYDARLRQSKLFRTIQASSLYQWFGYLKRIGERIW